MGVTEEELNFLRFYFLNLKIASKAVRVYFDYVHPPAGLGAELTKSSVTLKGLRFMTKLQLNILYPSPGQLVTSADFDTTLIVCLLRNLPPRELAPLTGWDSLPPPGDTSIGADHARVKWYRNQSVHSKDGILSSTDFNKCWDDLEGAIGRLSAKASLPMLKEAQLSKHVVLDGSLIDMLLELRSCTKSQQELTEMINIHQSAIDILMTNKEEHEKKIHQVNVSNQKGEAETQKLTTELSDYKNEYTEKLKACKNDINKNEVIIKELQDQSDKKQNKVADLIVHICKLEMKYEQHDKMLKKHDEHLAMLDGQGSKQGEQIAQQAEQLAQHCEQMAQHSEQMAQQGEQMAQQGEQMVQQRDQIAQQEDTRALIEEDVREGTFVNTKAVTDGLLLLKRNGVLLITGYAGTGKSRIGRHVLHMFCAENKSLKCIKLTLAEWDNMTNTKEKKDNREDNVGSRAENLVLLLDDIFGETNCIYNREKDTPILDKIHAYVCKGNIKVIITIRDTVKRHYQEVSDSHRLFQYDFIDLSSKNYVLSREEKHTILTKYMKRVHKSDFIERKGYVDCNGDLILKNGEVSNITRENPVKGFPLVVYQFVHNNKYFKLGSKFFDRPTEAMLEEMNAIRRKGDDQRKFMIQNAVMVYTAINENRINPDDNTTITEISKIIGAIYEKTIKLKKCNISDAVNELKGSYLISIPNQRSYKLHHPTLQESVILSFAQIDEEHINKIIPLISWSFFQKMVKPESYKEKEGEVVLRVPSNSYELLNNRLVDFFKESSGFNELYCFIINLCNTEVFQHEYSILLPCLLEAFEKEDDTDTHTENMIKSVGMDYFNSNFLLRNNKDKFLTVLLNTVAELESQLDIYKFVLKTFSAILKTSSNHVTIDFMKSTLITSLYQICSSKDVRSVKATLDIIEELKIPVLLDQGIIPTNIYDITSISAFREEYDDETCVFLTLCIWKAYAVCNIPVLEFLLSKYVRNPFDINLFFKIIYKDERIRHIIQLSRKRFLDSSSLLFEPLKWMLETFQDQELENPNLILRTACKFQMFDTVEYMASRCKTYDEMSCLQAFVDKYNFFVLGEIPFNQKLFDFLIKRIDITSKYLISVVKSVIKKENVPDYMFDAFLPVCIDNADILTLACEHGQFVLVNLIIESSHIEELDIQSALMAACRKCEVIFLNYHPKADDEVEKLKIVKYMVAKVGYEQFDFKALCQQACSSKRMKILEWFIQNIDPPRLDVYTIINSALVNKRSDILEHIIHKIEIESLDKWEVLKSVTDHYTAECSFTILKLVRTIWDSTHDKEVLQMGEIVDEAYERKYLELLMWIHDNCHPYISIDPKKVLMLACEDNRIDVAKWVLQTFEQTSLDIDGGNLFMIACSKTYEILQEQSIEMVKWILSNFQIKGCDFISGVLKLISDTMRKCNKTSNLIIYLLEKYFSFLNTDDIKEMINKSLEQKNYFLVNWFLKESGSCSFDKQMILNKACSDEEIETIKILSKYFYALDMTEAMIKACTSLSFVSYDILEEEEDYNADQSVACLGLLWNEVNKIGNDSIDIRTIVSTVCKEKKVKNNIMTWILLNLQLDQIPINDVLITCCQQSKIHHVKYIFHKVAIEQLDIRKAFVEACQAFPGDFQFQLQNRKPPCVEERWQKERNKPKYLMIVDSLFQMQSEKDSYLSLVQNEIIENKKFDLMLYFLQTGYCRNINMTDRLKEACRYGKCKLVQWIVVNVEHKELDIKSAFHEACDGVNYRVICYAEKQLENIKCLALMWHYIHDINMFEIDTVLNKMTETSDSNSGDDLKTWLLSIKNINRRIYQSDNALLNTEEYINKPSQQVNDGQCCLEDLQDNYDLNSRDEQDECPSPTKRLRLEREEQT
ncbi:Hypothetical predicted protein [Mytilus galloprovincialis]|uniref:DZIP3-like HEPN domain-containing protein n=1 Tax=Mytilus galloprovincialis TaxID=29158 RepID=A0A8B6FI84_MYTGA|nr:Hypothetical predicted protein [Mytilus galloprovincialis]